MPKRAATTAIPSIPLKRSSRVPLHQQIYGALRQAILDARIAPGDRLPSTRRLARALGVSRNVVANSYEQLLASGFLESRVGSGTRAARALPDTYLRELPLTTKDALGMRGKSFRRIVLEACTPVKASSFTDPDGNALFLFRADV